MAKQTRRVLTITTTGDGETDGYTSPTFQNDASPGVFESVALASGDNELELPPGTARRLTIRPPAGGTVGLTLKGDADDVGVPLSPSEDTDLGFPSAGPTTLILNAESSVTVRLIWS